MRKIIRFAAIALMAVLLFSATPALASGTWTQYGRSGHSSTNGDSVSFSGHPMDPFVSLLFRPANDGDYRVLTFHLTEGNSDWHTLEGSGFLFNAGISGGNLSGYAVLFTQSEVGFYKISNANANVLSNQHFTAISGVQKLESKPKPAYSSGTTWYLKLVMSPGTLKVEKYASPSFTGASEVIFSTVMNDTSSGSGYGPFASFISHDCPSISTSTLEYFNLTITPNTPPTVAAPDVTLNRGASFAQMSGVTANDKEDGDLTSAVKVTANNVDTSIPGVYNVTYAVTDLAGASTNHTRKVTVLADALFVVTDDKSGDPVQGVGITLSGQGAKASGANGETAPFIVTPGTYTWSVTTQHKDYLPLSGTFTANIAKDGASSWPMRIPVELTRKTYDVGVSLDVDLTTPLQYNDVATFTLTLTNNGNVPSIPTVKITVPEGLQYDGKALYTHDAAIDPGKSVTVELPTRVVNIAASGVERVSVSLSGLEAEGAAVKDGNGANDADSADVTVQNPPVVLTKTDALTDKPLAGVTIEITGADGESMYTGKSDASGQWTVHGLIPGEYTITETEGVAGYAKAASTWAFSRADDLSVSGDTTLTNSPLTLEIVKTDKHTGKAMEGVVFTIAPKDKADAPIKVKQQENGEWYAVTGSDTEGGAEIKTDKDGKIVLRYLPAGDYILTEKTPEGYADAKPTDVKIGQDNGMEKPIKTEIANLSTKLVFEKLDGLTGKPLRALATATDTAPAAFRLLNDKGEAVKLAATDGGLRPSTEGKEQFGVDANGIANILYLPVGSYTIEEAVAPAGYGVAEPIKIEVKGENSIDNPAKAQMSDSPLALHIQKEKKGGGALSGAGFTLTAKDSGKTLSFTVADGKYHYDPSGKDSTIMVDGKGEAFVYYLPAGEYTLTETVTPEGFFNAHPVSVKIGVENVVAKPAEVTVINEPEVKLGLDSDRWRVAGAVALIVLALGGATAFIILRKKEEGTQHGT